MNEHPEIEELDLETGTVGSGLQRRRFLRNAGLAGITAAWSAPLIQTVAYATGGHTPPGSPFTPGECPRDETTSGDTPHHDSKSSDSKHSGDRDSRDSRDTKDSGHPWDWSEDKNDSKDDWGWH